MGNYWLDLCKKEEKKVFKFKGVFQYADDVLPKGRIYSASLFESMLEKLEPRSLKEKISIENMEDAMIIYRLAREK